jgi:hypothetical protein
VPPANQTWSSIALSNDPTAVDKADPAEQLIFKVKSASWRAQRPFTPTCFSVNGDTVDASLVSDALIGFDVACKPTGYIELVLEEESGRISVTPSSLEAGSC